MVIPRSENVEKTNIQRVTGSFAGVQDLVPRVWAVLCVLVAAGCASAPLKPADLTAVATADRLILEGFT
jgi:hypothetical protein